MNHRAIVFIDGPSYRRRSLVAPPWVIYGAPQPMRRMRWITARKGKGLIFGCAANQIGLPTVCLAAGWLRSRRVTLTYTYVCHEFWVWTCYRHFILHTPVVVLLFSRGSQWTFLKCFTMLDDSLWSALYGLWLHGVMVSRFNHMSFVLRDYN